MGSQAVILAFVANLLGVNKQLLEDLQYKSRIENHSKTRNN
jgi:hypothetical protein